MTEYKYDEAGTGGIYGNDVLITGDNLRRKRKTRVKLEPIDDAPVDDPVRAKAVSEYGIVLGRVKNNKNKKNKSNEFADQANKTAKKAACVDPPEFDPDCGSHPNAMYALEVRDNSPVKVCEDEDKNFTYFESTGSDPQADGQLFVNVGKSERGKTHFTKALLAWKMNPVKTSAPLRFGIAFVKTKYKHSYDMLEDKQVFQGYDESVVQRYVDNLEKILAENGEIDANFVIFEDLTGILTNATPWFINWMATFRHLRTRIFINVQYLTGKNAISPIMREQVNVVTMFNSKTFRTLNNLYENFGQLFQSRKDFIEYFFTRTEEKKVGKYVAIVYVESIDDLTKNYIVMRAPEKIKFPAKALAKINKRNAELPSHGGDDENDPLGEKAFNHEAAIREQEQLEAGKELEIQQRRQAVLRAFR